LIQENGTGYFKLLLIKDVNEFQKDVQIE